MPGQNPWARSVARQGARLWLVFCCLSVVAAAVQYPSGLLQRLEDRLGLGDRPPAAGAPVAYDPHYRFLMLEPGSRDRPVTWSSCRAIQYRVNPLLAPPGAVATVHRVVREIEQDTGLRFHFAGLSPERPRWNSPYVPQVTGVGNPVLVSWATSEEVPQLAGDVAGIGGPVDALMSTGQYRYISGAVTMDASSSVDQEAIMRHEFGHLVGLAHVDDADELMAPAYTGQSRGDYAAGDRTGLRLLGLGGC